MATQEEPAGSAKREFLIGNDVTGKKKPTNYLETIIHCIKGYVGTGIFAMGAAMKNGGVILGTILLIIIAIISLHCQHLLITACIKVTGNDPNKFCTYGETVKYTFEDSSSKFLQKHSEKFGIMTDVFLLISEYGTCVVYFIFVSKHLGEIASAHGWPQDYRVVLAMILIPMWLSTFLGNLKLLMPVSLTSNIIMWVGIGFVLYYSTLDLPPLSDRNFVTKEPDKVPEFFGIALFAFQGITFIINLRTEMRYPEDFTSHFGILNMSMIVVALLYLLVGVLGYWQWGEEVLGSVFLNMPEHEALSQTAKILIAIGVLLSYALHMYIPFEILYPRFFRRFGPFKHPTLTIYIYKCAAVIFTYILANISSNLASFISLVGALAGSTVAMLLPAILQLVMLYGELTYYIIIKDTIIIIISIAGAITGTVVAIMDIVKDYTD